MECTVDTFALARSGRRLHGEQAIVGMERLASLLADERGSIGWRLHGWEVARPEGGADAFMALALTGTLQVPCVRCTGPVALPLSVEREYRLVATEAEAERLDLEDTRYDVLAGNRHFDLAGLIEDEAILALPITPRHEHCEMPATARTASDGQPGRRQASPFASLKRFRNGAQDTDIIED